MLLFQSIKVSKQPRIFVQGVFFFYDLSPIKVRFREERRSLMAFLTSACAIVGGVFTVSGIVDATIWAGQRAVRKKRELGKLI